MELDFQVRYFLEHKALPQALWNNRAQLLLSLLREKQNAMIDFYSRAEEVNPEYQCPYTAEQFSVRLREYVSDEGSVLIVRVAMPEPEAPLLCHTVYICFAGNDCDDAYFTSELEQSGKQLLCAWSKEGVHMSFGEVPEDDFAKVVELFWEMKRDGGFAEYKRVHD